MLCAIRPPPEWHPPGMLGSDPPLTLAGWLRFDVVQRLLPVGASRILEIGAGLGSVGARLAKRYEYIGLEPDPVSFDIAARRVGSLGLVLNETAESFKSAAHSFDVVGAFEVLEHCVDDVATLSGWLEHLAPGGHALVSVPFGRRRFGPWDRRQGTSVATTVRTSWPPCTRRVSSPWRPLSTDSRWAWHRARPQCPDTLSDEAGDDGGANDVQRSQPAGAGVGGNRDLDHRVAVSPGPAPVRWDESGLGDRRPREASGRIETVSSVVSTSSPAPDRSLGWTRVSTRSAGPTPGASTPGRNVDAVRRDAEVAGDRRRHLAGREADTVGGADALPGHQVVLRRLVCRAAG